MTSLGLTMHAVRMIRSPMHFLRKLALLAPIVALPLLSACREAQAQSSAPCPTRRPRTGARCSARIATEPECAYSIPRVPDASMVCYCDADRHRWVCQRVRVRHERPGPLPPPSLDG
ncbi:MAG: hypothetical protein Q8Q09_16245 [Deltaproteobacteria bacterium]|nr:hypothetical protein [Deltaproteobacteria bacterium]